MKLKKRLKRTEIMGILGDKTLTMDELIDEIGSVKSSMAPIEIRSCTMPLISSGLIVKNEDGKLQRK